MKNSKANVLQKNLREKRLAAGCCSSCNNPRHRDATYCLDHLQKRRTWEANRRTIRVASGGCGSCALGIPIDGTTMCLSCWWSSKASQFGNAEYIILLQQLWELQDGRCALSGLTLTPGFDASIDHIIPKSKGGTNDISNLRWLHISVNNGKNNMSDEVFIKVCEAVASHNRIKTSSE